MLDLTMRFHRATGRAVSLGLLALLASAGANAACLSGIKMSPSAFVPSGGFIPAVLRPGDPAGAALLQVSDTTEDAPIVGVWKFQLNGFLKDFGTQAFHAGGTETMFSAGVDPSTGDVCQGAWRRIGASTYTLNHIAMAWTAPGAEYGVLIHFHMTIHLAASGNAFTGHYSVSLYSATPDDPFNESAGAFASGTGNVSATRLAAD